MNKKITDKMLRELVYLDETDIKRCWRQAEGFARTKHFSGALYWNIVSRTAKKIAIKLNDAKMKKDI